VQARRRAVPRPSLLHHYHESGIAERDEHERIRRLLQAWAEEDVEYLIESLRRDPELAAFPAKWLSERGVGT
jgi:hypothetical protein